MGGFDPRAAVLMAKFFSAETRRQYAGKGWAMSDGSFPIGPDDPPEVLAAAIKLARSAAQRAHVKKRAAALGKTDVIPDSWNS